MTFRHILALLAALALAACAAPGASAPDLRATATAKTVFVTRHMRKAVGEDPPLSSAGTAAAQRLAELLADRGVTAIFATQTRRAMDSAAPLASRTSVKIIPYDPRYPQALVGKAAASRGSVLVVGHSNTVADLVERFGGTRPAELTEQDYGTVFAIDPAGKVTPLRVE